MKIVIILDDNLPAGVMANTAAALAMSCSLKIPGIVGEDVQDADMQIHPGLLTTPVAILSSNGKNLVNLKNAAEAADLGVIGFTDIARKSRSYKDYIKLMSAAGAGELNYIGICIYGEKSKVTGITGALPLVK